MRWWVGGKKPDNGLNLAIMENSKSKARTKAEEVVHDVKKNVTHAENTVKEKATHAAHVTEEKVQKAKDRMEEKMK